MWWTGNLRHRHAEDVGGGNRMEVLSGEKRLQRVALNMPIQGTAADIIKLAMVKVFDRLKRENLVLGERVGGDTVDNAKVDRFSRPAHLTGNLRHRHAEDVGGGVDGLLKVIPPDGRVRTSFQMTVTATGRLSSTAPARRRRGRR